MVVRHAHKTGSRQTEGAAEGVDAVRTQREGERRGAKRGRLVGEMERGEVRFQPLPARCDAN